MSAKGPAAAGGGAAAGKRGASTDKAAAAAAAAAAGPGKHAAAALPPPLPLGGGASHDDDDSQAGDQLVQPQLLQSALLQSALLGDGDNEGEEEGDGEFAAVAAAINRLIKAKQGKQQQRQQAMLKELQEQVLGQLQDFEAVTAKEHKEVERLVASTCSGQSKKLSEKFRAIEAINAKYQQDLKAAWEDYNAIFTRVEDTKDQTLALLEKRRAGQKRKLAALQDSLAERVADAEARLAKLTSSAAKQRNISDVLKCLMPSADQD